MSHSWGQGTQKTRSAENLDLKNAARQKNMMRLQALWMMIARLKPSPPAISVLDSYRCVWLAQGKRPTETNRDL